MRITFLLLGALATALSFGFLPRGLDSTPPATSQEEVVAIDQMEDDELTIPNGGSGG